MTKGQDCDSQAFNVTNVALCLLAFKNQSLQDTSIFVSLCPRYNERGIAARLHFLIFFSFFHLFLHSPPDS